MPFSITPDCSQRRFNPNTLPCCGLFQEFSTVCFIRLERSSRPESVSVRSGACPDKSFIRENIACFRAHHKSKCIGRGALRSAGNWDGSEDGDRGDGRGESVRECCMLHRLGPVNLRIGLILPPIRLSGRPSRICRSSCPHPRNGLSVFGSYFCCRDHDCQTKTVGPAA